MSPTFCGRSYGVSDISLNSRVNNLKKQDLSSLYQYVCSKVRRHSPKHVTMAYLCREWSGVGWWCGPGSSLPSKAWAAYMANKISSVACYLTANCAYLCCPPWPSNHPDYACHCSTSWVSDQLGPTSFYSRPSSKNSPGCSTSHSEPADEVLKSGSGVVRRWGAQS